MLFYKEKSFLFFQGFIVVYFIAMNFCFGQKINGINLVSPQYKMPKDLTGLKQITPNWVAISPVVLLEKGNPTIQYPSSQNFRGDHPDMVRTLIQKAQKENYNILLKPLFRVDYFNWAGDFVLNGYLQSQFEENFKLLTLEFARIAQEEQIDMLCIGTELKTFIDQKPIYWNELIYEVKKIYKGKLTYAANWDNLYSIPFWDQLDYIGVDAYFPLSEQNTPTIQRLNKAWRRPIQDLEKLAQKHNKKIIFTEYGYRSIDHSAWKQWEFERTDEKLSINLEAQKIAYQALFENAWKQPWFAGGFAWKWFIDNPNAGGHYNSNYTPQNKPVISIIKQWYTSNNY